MGEAPIMRPSDEAELVMLYDGDCAVCTATARFVRARDQDGRIECADLQVPEQAARFPDFTAEQVRALLHAVDGEGRVTVGVDALAEVGERLPRWWLPARLVRLPVIHWLAVRFYGWFARNRYALNRVLGDPRGPHQDCTGEGGACAVDFEKLKREGRL